MEISAGIQASLSGRYATALFELAHENRQIDSVESSLAAVREGLNESDEFARLIASPLVARDAATKAVAAVAESIGLDPITTNFLGVLAQNRRLSQLPAVIRAYRTLASRHRGEINADVVSAHPLSDAQTDALKQQLRTRVGRDVNIDLSVDPDLLGGMIVKIGSQMIDSSIKTRLNTLALAMKG